MQILKKLLHPETLTDDDRRARRRRWQDRWSAKANRFWLAVLTVLWVWVSLTLSHQQNVADDTRIESISQRCELISTINSTALRLGVPYDSEDLGDLRDLEAKCRKTLRVAQSNR